MISIEISAFGIIRDVQYHAVSCFLITICEQYQHQWVVYRTIADFSTLGMHLQQIQSSKAPRVLQSNSSDEEGKTGFPLLPKMDPENTSDDYIALCRIHLQMWLNSILSVADMEDPDISMHLRQFLLSGANSPPPNLQLLWLNTNHSNSINSDGNVNNNNTANNTNHNVTTNNDTSTNDDNRKDEIIGDLQSNPSHATSRENNSKYSKKNLVTSYDDEMDMDDLFDKNNVNKTVTTNLAHGQVTNATPTARTGLVYQNQNYELDNKVLPSSSLKHSSHIKKLTDMKGNNYMNGRLDGQRLSKKQIEDDDIEEDINDYNYMNDGRFYNLDDGEEDDEGKIQRRKDYMTYGEGHGHIPVDNRGNDVDMEVYNTDGFFVTEGEEVEQVYIDPMVKEQLEQEGRLSEAMITESSVNMSDLLMTSGMTPSSISSHLHSTSEAMIGSVQGMINRNSTTGNINTDSSNRTFNSSKEKFMHLSTGTQGIPSISSGSLRGKDYFHPNAGMHTPSCSINNTNVYRRDNANQNNMIPSSVMNNSFCAACAAQSGHRNSLPRKAFKMGLDSFKMIKVIGKGSFGKVFLVRDISSAGRMYAMKVLQKEHIIRRNQVEHTKTERNVLGYIKHPFIVGLNFAFQTRDKLYFVLDYCAGGELFFHLGRIGTFSESRARFYTAEIALALEHVHKLDIIYRDLKPENVLLDTQGHVRLTDFGLSKEGITNNVSGATSFCGTPEYLAPEILNRQGHGRAVDWWSLGALLYEMLTGLPPFYSKDRDRLFEKIRSDKLTFPQDKVSRNARKLLIGLLTRDPSFRLGSGQTDAEEVKSHIFFTEGEIDWDKLMKKEIPVPWEPTISGSLDTSQFDKEFTNMPILSPEQQTSRLAQFDNKLFDGFTFTDENIHLSSSIIPQNNFQYGSLHRQNNSYSHHHHHHNHPVNEGMVTSGQRLNYEQTGHSNQSIHRQGESSNLFPSESQPQQQQYQLQQEQLLRLNQQEQQRQQHQQQKEQYNTSILGNEIKRLQKSSR